MDDEVVKQREAISSEVMKGDPATAGASKKIIKPSATAAEWYCPTCLSVIQLTSDGNLVGRDSTGRPLILLADGTSKLVDKCPRCQGQLTSYTVERLATLLFEQMKLLDEAKKVDEENRRLKRETSIRRYFHPSTGKIVPETQTATAGILGRVRIGWDPSGNPGSALSYEGAVYELSEAGLSQMRDRITSRASASTTLMNDLRQQLAARDAEISRLQAVIRSGGGDTMTSARRSLR